MESLFAKALYDNPAESPDELGFRKGEVVLVVEQEVEGSSGWWRCSLRGQEGLAPANRLMRLSQAEAEALGLKTHQNMYQTPRVTRASAASPTYEIMDQIYTVPSVPGPQTNAPFPRKAGTPELPELPEHKVMPTPPAGSSDVYDVPNLLRKASLFTTTLPRPLVRKTSLMPTTNIQRRYETMDVRKWKPCQADVNVTPSVPQEPNYDIPVPSNSDLHRKPSCGYSTMPNPRKSEWIYDVPVVPEKSCVEVTNLGTTTSYKAVNPSSELYDTLPARVWPAKTSSSSVYDIPKPCVGVDACKPGNESIYDVPPSVKQRETSLALQKQQSFNLSSPERDPEPLEYRGNRGPMYDLPRGRPSWGRKVEISGQPKEQSRGLEVKERESKGRVSENQRSSTASTTSTSSSSSSRSSCDSLMLSSPSPEPLREVTLSQEEVSQKLLELQDAVCRAIPKLMDFVSSSWRSREHLGRHLEEIRQASELVANSLTSFLDFALDVRGNARRLTDSNLQARLQKQLSIVEDSGLILQQSAEDLGGLGWSLDALVQDPGQPHTPDQLERFVMVARTVPEDVKRLVSILNANAKLLFRSSSKEAETPKKVSPKDERKSLGKIEPPPPEVEGDDNDYVQLQTKTEFEQQQMKTNDKIKPVINEENKVKQLPKPAPPKPPGTNQTSSKSSQISDHCRLYFGAIRKAIAVLVTSLEEGQPPEKFISHSKLVIMVGQRLMDALCGEAQTRPDSQELLCKSNHLCALLKQLAVATKKAALHFPDKVAVQEARDFARELAQRTHHFRMSLDS